MVRRTAEEVFIPFTIGGGIRSVDDARALLRAGADKVSINTSAIERPDLIGELATEFGAQCVVVAIDARRCPPDSDLPTKSGYEVFTHGGRTATGADVVWWARRAQKLGAGEILLTSMDRDGTRDGFDLELVKAVSQAVTIPVIASGGVGTLAHLVDGVLEGGADAVLAASIFHFGECTVGQAKDYLADHGIVTRPVPPAG